MARQRCNSHMSYPSGAVGPLIGKPSHSALGASRHLAPIALSEPSPYEDTHTYLD
jgi:hypothetical protein